MSSSSVPLGDDDPSQNSSTTKDSGSGSATPVTPQKSGGPSGGLTPKSANAGAAGPRLRSVSKKAEPPTLLTDFLMGRQSPARKAAERERRRSLEAVKAELRHEMKQAKVRQLQAPGGVKERVKAWQRANTNVLDPTCADDAATEPTDVAFREEEESVTEEDRVRIKLKQKKKPWPKEEPAVKDEEGAEGAESAENAHGENGQRQSTSQPPPKLRVVSDDNWMKTRKAKRPSPRKVSPSAKKSPSPGPGPGTGLSPSPSPSPNAIPKDFVLRSSPNPNVSNKVKAWAEKVDLSVSPPPSPVHRSSKSAERSVRSDGKDSETEGTSDVGSSSQLTAKLQRRRRSDANDGIRIKPVRRDRSKTVSSSQDEERSHPSYPDDGIRVRPAREAPTKVLLSSAASSTGDTDLQPAVKIHIDPPESTLLTSSETTTVTDGPAAQTRASKRQRPEESGRPEPEKLVTIDELNSLLEMPAKQKAGKGKSNSVQQLNSSVRDAGGRLKAFSQDWKRRGEREGEGGEEEDSRLAADQAESHLSSSSANKSVADLPGEIPFGHSAFSELDLPLHGAPKSRPKRAQPGRSTSLKGINVFKKVVEEGKKMIQDMNEQAKPPVANNPPSIEKWLSGTVDPFIEEPARQGSTEATELKREDRESTGASKEKRLSHEQKNDGDATPVTEPAEARETPVRASKPDTEKTPTPLKITNKSPTSGGLQRRRATRGASSPLKSGSKRPFLGVLKEAFTGESSNRIHLPKSYHGLEQRNFDDDDDDGDDDYYSSDFKSSLLSEEMSSVTEELPQSSQPTLNMAGPRFRPPTKGRQLSTILSRGSSAVESDVSSEASQSTLTQSTAVTTDSNATDRKSSGLKRRLTKHSDLVSVLSLPENSDVPQGVRSSRSRPSQRKARGDVNVSVEDLLQEFEEDEHIYQRELKTLVDGVVPVLLSHVIHGEGSQRASGSLPERPMFGYMSKSVIAMGVSLEKMKNAHRKAPFKDIRRLADWTHGVVPIYDSYLSAWRLGFQELSVNLAPRNEAEAEDDSLLNAMPRNAKGDVINEAGEKVDVAHLLKRPLLRIKHMVKLLSCVNSILATNETAQLLRDFESLQDKARRRHREELARQTDEEAAGTDTTRARDLRTLGTAPSISIDACLQVNAKDIFSLDLAHSNGQRLECQVELVHRDRQGRADGQGDILIREVGDGRGRRSYLLFPPLPMSDISARTGEGNSDMVIMIRGFHLGKQWHELLTLSADDEDQILDWLDILPLTPVPPREPEPSVVGDAEDDEPVHIAQNTPVGAAFVPQASPKPQPQPQPQPPLDDPAESSPIYSKTPVKRSLPSRYHPNRRAQPAAAMVASAAHSASEETPTQRDYRGETTSPLGESQLLGRKEQKLPEPWEKSHVNSSPPSYLAEEAPPPPPPPAHRTLHSASDQQSDKSKLRAPEDLSSQKMKRRTSSPLKHEYLPSDVSSGSETASYSEESDPESSDDEIESIDIPETEIGISISKKEDELPVSEEPITGSVCSLTPSNSASQAGLYGHKTAPEDKAARYYAQISRWSEKGLWKDVSSAPFSVIVTAGLVEAFPLRDNNEEGAKNNQPHIALDLTPLVLIRQSTAVDLEIRSSLQPHSRLHNQHSGGNFRFRCNSAPECFSLYMSVHHARLNNQKFIQLENEARFRSFGERTSPAQPDGDSSSRRRSWFGRKNSYRSSVRAPSQDGASTTPSSSPSASSFLKRLSVAGSLSFNLARSSVDRQSGGGSNSLYTSSSSSGTPPRSPSISVNNSGRTPTSLGSDSIRIRLHLLVSAAKWEDFGNCSLQIRRPPPGWHQALRADHGLEKRITVTAIPRKETDQPRIVLDAVLGSACFTPMGTRGVVCGIWEDNKGEGVVSATGPTGGNIKKWCFQFAGAMEANWALRLVHQEVVTA